MAAANTISAFSICRPKSLFSSLSSCPQFVQFRTQNPARVATGYSSLSARTRRRRRRIRIRAVAEEAQEEEEAPAAAAAATSTVDQTVSVQVSPSDVLTMFFRAEGTMNETAIPTVTKALEEIEGITDLKVQVLEGIASVELTKQTTVQATGVASGLVETIQGSGFKLQALNLSFQDDEDIS